MSADAEGSVQKVAELMKDARIAMVTSVAADGRLVSRPLSVQQVEFDGDLWFFVDREAELLQQVLTQPQVNVALQSKDSWVSVSGTASLVEDPARARELWNPVAAAWFDAEGSTDTDADDPGPAELGAVLVKVDGSTAEYWESAGRLATAVSLLKAQVTRGDVEATRNETVELP
ncbi:pyridoxamine 5'-phosphate oxidase [Auraticoccus sp. F435]|uniref:Pyridoxamine 5'-phosphate oxidase n=1 Tax=Auraticoccus cholistanensis TaxID=2656650 RepID=A0A6A9UUB0_9ACTN|nr:pyridoxamine 5'-phosphate oxidase family protein [Auraticoccus cholistanensis]MVA75325.1 pyridoxamine 5'-phosphate oxidase [Auraticoccus cholistanensis]